VTWACSAVWAAVVTWALHPGWLFYDSAIQWGWAGQILTGRSFDPPLLTQWPLSNTFIKVPFLLLGGGIGLYAFVQATALFAVAATLVHQRIPMIPATITALAIAAAPVVWHYAAFHTIDTPTAILITALFSAFSAATWSETRKLWTVCLLCAALAWLRDSAIPLAVGVCVFALLRTRTVSSRTRYASALLVAVIVTYSGATRFMRGHFYDSSIAGFVSRMALIQEEAQTQQARSLVAPFFTTLPSFGNECYDAMMWCKPQQMNARGEFAGRRELTPQVRRAFIELVLSHPVASVKVLAKVAAGLLGFPAPVPDSELGRSDFPKNAVTLESSDGSLRWELHSVLSRWRHAFWGLFARPGMVILLGALAALFLGGPRFKDDVRLTGLILALYCGPMLLLAPARDFRYLFPAYLPMFVLMTVGVTRILLKTFGYRSEVGAPSSSATMFGSVQPAPGRSNSAT